MPPTAKTHARREKHGYHKSGLFSESVSSGMAVIADRVTEWQPYEGRLKRGQHSMFMMPGGWEWLVVFAVALIVFGPKRLPEIGKQVGKGMRMFRDASREIQNHLNLDDLDYTPPRKPPRRISPPVLPNMPEGTSEGASEGTSTESLKPAESTTSEQPEEENKPDGYPREEIPTD